jgi:uncharacterized protein
MAYRDVLSQIWLLDPVPGWLPSRSYLSMLAQAPEAAVVPVAAA